MARAQPKPFQRPGINLDHPVRTWQDVGAFRLSIDDIVPDHGRIIGIMYWSVVGHGSGHQVEVEFLSGEKVRYSAEEKVHAFTEGIGGPLGEPKEFF